MGEHWNWARTFCCRPRLFFEPLTIDDLRSILIRINENRFRVRVIGCGHSPSSLSMSDEVLISMKKLNRVISIDRDTMQIDLESGVLLSTLNDILPQYGLSLPVQGSVSSITVAGAISTATHGSGIGYGTLSSYVRSIRLMRLDGEETEYSDDKDEELFRCLTCSLGSFGVITLVRLQLVPQFDLELNRYYLSLNSFLNSLKTHCCSSAHFRYMWYPHTHGGVAYHLSRVTPRNIDSRPSLLSKFVSWIRSSLIGHHLLEVLFLVSLLIPRLVVVINRLYLWLDSRCSHSVARCDRLFNFDCLFLQYASEWALPLDSAVSCVVELNQWIEGQSDGRRVHYPIEIRFSRSEDRSYLSPGFERETCWLNAVAYRPYGIGHSQHRPFFEAFERICHRHGGRPHWAKEHPLTGRDLRQLYPKWDLFHEKRQQFDPNSLFVNDCLEKMFSISK